MEEAEAGAGQEKEKEKEEEKEEEREEERAEKEKEGKKDVIVLSEKHWFRVLQCMGQSLHILDLDGRIIYWNHSAELLYGYSCSEALGCDAIALLLPPDPHTSQTAAAIFRRVITAGDRWAGKLPVRTKSGHHFLALSTHTPFYDDHASLLGVVCVSTDFTLHCDSSFHANSTSTTGSTSTSAPTAPPSVNELHFETDCFDCEILWEDLTIAEHVGQGSCATVYHALWYGSDVAVKVFSMQQYSEDVILSFRQEVSLMKRLRHPNILLFMGVVTSTQRLCIVTEYLPRGSLFNLLQKNSARLDWRRRIHMALDIARGMNYLHHCNPPIIHRDLKSSNLLVDKNWTVKVADFGLSRLKRDTFLTTKSGKGTPQWMAPEVLRNEPADEKSDVYSYGVILWELITQKIPWEHLNSIQVIGAIGFMNQRLELPNDTDSQWASIIQSCWESEPRSRPTFQELVERLRDLLRQYNMQHQLHRSTSGDPTEKALKVGIHD